MVALFAKGRHGRDDPPANEPTLDQMIDVLAHAERKPVARPAIDFGGGARRCRATP